VVEEQEIKRLAFATSPTHNLHLIFLLEPDTSRYHIVVVVVVVVIGEDGAITVTRPTIGEHGG
jgi:hypothetical protein